MPVSKSKRIIALMSRLNASVMPGFNPLKYHSYMDTENEKENFSKDPLVAFEERMKRHISDI